MNADHVQRVIIVANPKSGARSRADLIEQLCHSLKEQTLAPEICGDLESLKARIDELHQARSLQAVVAAGGDGTVSVVAERTPIDVPIGILPLGTENLVAKFLGLSCDPAGLARAIKTRSTRKIDCGLANGKLFLVMVGIGFDAQVVLEMSRQRKGHIRRWSYTLPILKSIQSYRFPELAITTAMEESSLSMWRARWIFVANLPKYAAGLPIANWAESDDGALDVCSFEGGGILRSLWYFLCLAFNRHRSLTAFQTHKAHRIRIEVAEHSDSVVPYQLDGDFGGVLPLEIQVLPNRLTVLVPSTA